MMTTEFKPGPLGLAIAFVMILVLIGFGLFMLLVEIMVLCWILATFAGITFAGWNLLIPLAIVAVVNSLCYGGSRR